MSELFAPARAEHKLEELTLALHACTVQNDRVVLSKELFRELQRLFLPENNVVDAHDALDGFMDIAAFRYCFGRESYAGGAGAEWVIENAHRFSLATARTMLQDMNERLDLIPAPSFGQARLNCGDFPYEHDWRRARTALQKRFTELTST